MTTLEGPGVNDLFMMEKPMSLQRAASDSGVILGTLIAEEGLATIMEEEEAKCQCCGFVEDCTPAYVQRIREAYCGQFMCGLCAEATKEECLMGRATSIEEALELHNRVCIQFNTSTRAIPAVQLAATSSMRTLFLRRLIQGPVKSTVVSKNFRYRTGLTRSNSSITSLSR